MSTTELVRPPARKAALGTFERYLTLWVVVCIAAGVLLGHLVPAAFGAIAAAELAHVNLPVAVLVWLMIVPMLLKIDLAALGQVTQWINDHKTYTPAAKQTFLGCSDYFVVAQALAGRHTLITHEKPENSVHRVKIPSVCVALKIKYMTCWQMLRTERARFVLQQLAAGRSGN